MDQTLFADYKLTMINVWATYCSPCINEMPDLGRLHADMAAEGVQIVGLVSDALDSSGNISQSQVDLARDIIEATGANYPHMLPSQDLISTVLWQVTAVPTTIFVDHTGELVGYAYAGSRSYDQWTAIIYDTLSLLEDASEETSEPRKNPRTPRARRKRNGAAGGRRYAGKKAHSAGQRAVRAGRSLHGPGHLARRGGNRDPQGD